VRREVFEVVRLLPEEHGMWRYRIKSVVDGHERVVLERELTWGLPAPSPKAALPIAPSRPKRQNHL
jgi:hypothetical protein